MEANKTAPIPSGVYLSSVSTTLLNLAPPSTPPSSTSSSSPSSTSSLALPSPPTQTQPFTDHYAILALSISATTEDIKTAFRRLRADFFRTDLAKYRALQAAYDVLVDREAREAYDAMCRKRMGLPGVKLKGRVRGLVERVQGGLEKVREEKMREEKEREEKLREEKLREEKLREEKLREEKLREAKLLAEQLLAEQKRADPNWALKHSTPVYKPLIGTRPYQSYVPIGVAYEGRIVHLRWKCGRPKYVLSKARGARP
ncbi:hypothetical protein BDV95DRAFT_617818 [Massariosphaeria phaeospora]|uniref:J domain-containing protein n=1 Tax=Massariosphaeria phaeospora TaxID=100035 RepID=A0A7C8ME57_9PLEO|nr:hypothetical protein BDV95DRAFT_617818 [Massariosphaeria phaeospora]